ncbi:MAG: hypothetical protein EP343_14195 [Deltaproteobacteria bacterium]|nr:MAG: hypothetical protein EP343_14195 [Deltaproteobacteria bacterium]
MGHRANYAIKEHGTYRLYYSHWGALTVPEDIFWGPDVAESFITSHDQIDPTDWLDEVWGEGGAALDKDTKTLALFGGDMLGYGPLHPTFSALMDVLWSQQGWTVMWVPGMPEIAAAVGADPNLATAPAVGPFPVDPETLGERYYGGKTNEQVYLAIEHNEQEVVGTTPARMIDTLLSLSGDGKPGWSDGVVDATVADFLSAGPEVLDYVHNLPSLEEVRAFHASRPLHDWEDTRSRLLDEFTGCVAIDLEAKMLWVGVDFLRAHIKDCIREAWDEWTVSFHTEGFAKHFDLTGRKCPPDLTERLLPREDEPKATESPSEAEDAGPDLELSEALRQIAEILLGPRNNDPGAFLRDYVQSLSGGEEIQTLHVNPHALQSPQDGRPHEIDCLALFEDAVYALQHRPSA